MDNLDKNLNPKQENDRFNSNYDDDRTVFVPAEEIRVIENIINMLEQAQQEFCKAAKGMRAVNDLELNT